MGAGWSWGRGSGDPCCTLRHKEDPRAAKEPPQLAPCLPYTGEPPGAHSPGAPPACILVSPSSCTASV